MSIALRTDQVKEALKTYDKQVSIALDGKKTTTIDFKDENKDLLEFLSEAIPMTGVQKAKIMSFIYQSKESDLGEVEVKSASDLYKRIAYFTGSTEPPIEVKIADKWYPVLATVDKFKGWTGEIIVTVHAFAMVGALQYTTDLYVGPWSFEEEDDGTANPKTIDEVLGRRNMRIATKDAVAHAKQVNSRLIEFASESGRVYDGWGPGLTYHQFWGWESMNVAWKDAPATVVIEPDLENEYAEHERYGRRQAAQWHLPFVRVFSFLHKEYMWVDLENLKKHEYHREGIKKIVLPEKMLTALGSIFNAAKGNIFGDLFHGRHGGIVVLANGPSGVGKTLTAEVFAEFQERPLYTMEMGEIGTNLTNVEENLRKIFARAKKWNAVLLFDEADIFLSEREASDLERSAIVGIFLRLLDYYEGTFFLTTNRGEGIDKAFKSRVTLYLNYPELSPETRKKIWDHMLEAAQVNVTESTEPKSNWNAVIQAKLNGRQIRNQVRLLKLMHPDGTLTTKDIVSTLEFAAQ